MVQESTGLREVNNVPKATLMPRLGCSHIHAHHSQGGPNPTVEPKAVPDRRLTRLWRTGTSISLPSWIPMPPWTFSTGQMEEVSGFPPARAELRLCKEVDWVLSQLPSCRTSALPRTTQTNAVHSRPLVSDSSGPVAPPGIPLQCSD